MTLAAIVLAAGRGTRYTGGTKMLALFAGQPLVRRAAEAALAAGLSPVLVVTGHDAVNVEAALAGLDVALVRNPGYADGMSTSLRAGFAALPSGARAAVILLGDMPGIGADLVRHLAESWAEAGEPPALVPVFAGRRGNPVVLSAALAPAVAALTGDSGAGPLLRGLDGVVSCPVEDAAVTADADTPEALRALQASTTPWSTAT